MKANLFTKSFEGQQKTQDKQQKKTVTTGNTSDGDA